MKRPLSLLAAVSLFAILLGVAAAPSPPGLGLRGWAKSIISLLSVRSAMAAPRSSYSAKLEKTQYRGWNVYKLTNGLVSLFIAPEIGGRAIQL